MSLQNSVKLPKILHGFCQMQNSRVSAVEVDIQHKGHWGLTESMNCVDLIINHLFFIFQDILQLDTYYEPWLRSTTIVLQKPGKPSYSAPKAYRPIGLLDTTVK